MASQKIVFYSCLVNKRDDIKPIWFQDGFEHVLFTDNTEIVPTLGWDIRPLVWTSPDPTRTSRYHKHHPFDLFPDASYAIWLDMTHWQYASLKPLLSNQNLVLHRHQLRNTARAEAIECASINFDEPNVLLSQIKYYTKEGFPDNIGLYATSCLIMRNTYEYRKLSEMWWEEICRWSKRDQVSLPYCLWKLGITPGIIPGVDRGGFSPYFKFKSHYIKT